MSSCDKTSYFKVKRDLFLTLTDLKHSIATTENCNVKFQHNAGFAETYRANVYSGDWVATDFGFSELDRWHWALFLDKPVGLDKISNEWTNFPHLKRESWRAAETQKIPTTHCHCTQTPRRLTLSAAVLSCTWVRKARFTCMHNWFSHCARWKTDVLLCSMRSGKKEEKHFPLAGPLMWEEMDCHLSLMHRYGWIHAGQKVQREDLWKRAAYQVIRTRFKFLCD